MKKCVYTIRFGNHDASHEPPKSEGWDYIVFSDREIESDVWETRIITTPLPNYLAARYVYINSQRFVSDYDYSLMVGGQIHINGDLNKFWDEHIDEFADFNMMKHCRNCIYKEADVVIRENIDKSGNAEKVIEKYRAEGFPEEYGLNACGIIGRHKSRKIAEFEDKWWNQVLQGSYRDQLSFDYIRWIFDKRYPLYPKITVNNFGYWETLNSEWFSVHQHGTGNRITG